MALENQYTSCYVRNIATSLAIGDYVLRRGWGGGANLSYITGYIYMLPPVAS